MTEDANDEVRYRFGLTLVIPLSRDLFNQSGYENSPFSWASWCQFRREQGFPHGASPLFSPEEEVQPYQDLTADPDHSPWLRVPGAYFEGRQPTEVYLKHIEELLYPGMGLLRWAVDQSGKKAPKTLIFPPTKRVIGLPNNPKEPEEVVLDFGSLKTRSKFRGQIRMSVDAGEVFSIELGPIMERLGPVTLGVLHLSLKDRRHDSVGDELDNAWGAQMLKDVIYTLTAPIVEFSPPELPERGNKPFPLQRVRGGRVVKTDCPSWLERGKYFPSAMWLAASYFGSGLGASQEPRLVQGAHFIVQIPPAALTDNHDLAETSETEGDTHGYSEKSVKQSLRKIAALARDEEDGSERDVTGRIISSTTYRGTALLDCGPTSEGNFLTDLNTPAFNTIDGIFLRNFRSYWFQGVLLGIIQHQLLKRFSNHLGITGGDFDSKKLTNVYQEWLVFRNSAWWTELTYARPAVDNLLSNYRQALRLQQSFNELHGDFETYTGFAEREHDRDIGRKLRLLQILGAGLVAFGIGGVVAEISYQYGNKALFGIPFWALIAIFATLSVWWILRDRK